MGDHPTERHVVCDDVLRTALHRSRPVVSGAWSLHAGVTTAPSLRVARRTQDGFARHLRLILVDDVRGVRNLPVLDALGDLRSWSFLSLTIARIPSRATGRCRPDTSRDRGHEPRGRLEAPRVRHLAVVRGPGGDLARVVDLGVPGRVGRVLGPEPLD